MVVPSFISLFVLISSSAFYSQWLIGALNKQMISLTSTSVSNKSTLLESEDEGFSENQFLTTIKGPLGSVRGIKHCVRKNIQNYYDLLTHSVCHWFVQKWPINFDQHSSFFFRLPPKLETLKRKKPTSVFSIQPRLE